MPISIKIDGIDQLIRDVNKTVSQANEETKVALTKFAANVQEDAKTALHYGANGRPTSNTGQLASSIHKGVQGMTASIVVTADYAAYIEFGTRKFAAAYVATLPQDWSTYAATFKGKGGGTFAQFLAAILKWVEDRGIGGLQTKSGNVSKSKDSKAAQKQAAYLIALSILRNGIRPQPFLFPAVKKHTPVLITDIKKIFG